MSDIVRALGFGALPTAIIVALSAGLAWFIKREFKGVSSKINKIDTELQLNNELTSKCAETSRLLLLEKMRFFAMKERRTKTNDAYFQNLYNKFERLGNGFDDGIMASWLAKPLEA